MRLALIFFISSIVLNAGARPFCTVHEVSASSQMNILTSATTSALDSSSFELYQRSLQCRERIWQTKSTQLGTREIHFVDLSTNSACTFSPQKQNCVPEPKTFLSIPDVRSAINDLSGYAIVPGNSERTERLMLNASTSSIESRVRETNRPFIKGSQDNVHRCHDKVTHETLGLNEISLPKTPGDFAGFFLHEDFHLAQRAWQPTTTPSHAGNEIETEAFFNWERTAFHLLRFLKLKATDSKSASKHLSHARNYWETLKRKFPERASELANREEGSAFFVEARAKILFERGCSIDQTELDDLVTSELLRKAGEHATLKASPYILGALASQALEVFGVKNWREKVEGAASPLHVLFQEVGPRSVAETSPARAAREFARCLTEKVNDP